MGEAFTSLVIALWFGGHIDVSLLMIGSLVDEGGEANNFGGRELAAHRQQLHNLPLQIFNILV